MRILEVIPHFTPAKGGSARIVYDIARHLGEKGHDVTVVASDFGIRDARFAEGPFRFVSFRSVSSRWNFYVTPTLPAWARDHVKGFDVVHLHEVRTLQNAIIARAARRSHVPYLLSAHGTLPIVVQRQLAKKAFDCLFRRILFDSASYFVAVSPTEVDQYKRADIQDARIRLVLNGLDLDEFAHLPQRGEFLAKCTHISERTNLVLYLGRLHRRKGIDCLMEAFGRLLEQAPDSLLAVVGPDDGEQGKLESLARRLRLADKVLFIGPLYGKDKLAALVDADVLATPAVHEIFGLVPFEALMCGTPVVVGDDCGSGQIIAEAGAGYRVPYGDIPALTETLLRAISNRAESERLVRAGQAFVRAHLDWNAVIVGLEDVYSEVSAAAARGDRP